MKFNYILIIGLILATLLVAGCTSSSGDAAYNKYSQMSASDIKSQAAYVYGPDFLTNPDNYKDQLIDMVAVIDQSTGDDNGENAYIVNLNKEPSGTPYYAQLDFTASDGSRFLSGDRLIVYGIYEGNSNSNGQPIVMGLVTTGDD